MLREFIAEADIQNDEQSPLAEMSHDKLLNKDRAEVWIPLNRAMVDYFNQYVWDQQTLTYFKELYNQKIEELKAEGFPDAAKQFSLRWNGWVAEASVQRIFADLGIKLIESEDLDANAVDFMRVVHDFPQDTSRYLFFQVKAKADVEAGVFVFDMHKAVEPDHIPGTNIIVGHFLDYQQLKKARPDGDMHDFCLKLSKDLFAAIKKKRSESGKPVNEKHRALVFLQGIGVGMKRKGSEQPGWLDLMNQVGSEFSNMKRNRALTEDDSLHRSVSNALIEILSSDSALAV